MIKSNDELSERIYCGFAAKVLNSSPKTPKWNFTEWCGHFADLGKYYFQYYHFR